MKNILLLIHDDSGAEARFQAALDVTRAVDGHLTCVDIVHAPVLYSADPYMDEAAGVLFAEAHAREATNRPLLQARLAVEDISWDWIDATGDFATILERESRLDDLIVLNTRLGESHQADMMAIIGDVVTRSGKPILAAPELSRGLDVDGDVLIAWDGSAAVTEAVQAVIPLLALARSVTLLQLGKTPGALAVDAATYLSRHGIHSEVEYGGRPSGSIGQSLLTTCDRMRPAYCVMGAYGHSRLREGFFGGVTRHMLAASPVPLVLGH